jgi:signal recognition particle receptor subunit beta
MAGSGRATIGGEGGKGRLNGALQKGTGQGAVAGVGKKRKAAKPNLLLLCGPTSSGKTALFYHLLTKEARTTVTSIEINETPALMEVKIPQQQEGSTVKKINIIDVPGHYHFKGRLNEALDEAKAIILVVDSKEK